MEKIPSQRQLSRWSRRQRKKHHAGEFQELGFSFALRLEEPLHPTQVDAFMDAAIEMLEANALFVGGGWDAQSASGFVVADKACVTEAQRLAVLAWLRAWPGVAQVKASALRDAWHGDFDTVHWEDA